MQKVINVFNELPKEVIASQTTHGCSGGRDEERGLLQERRRQGAVLCPAQCPRKTGRHSSCPQPVPSKGRSECISRI